MNANVSTQARDTETDPSSYSTTSSADEITGEDEPESVEESEGYEEETKKASKKKKKTKKEREQAKAENARKKSASDNKENKENKEAKKKQQPQLQQPVPAQQPPVQSLAQPITKLPITTMNTNNTTNIKKETLEFSILPANIANWSFGDVNIKFRNETTLSGDEIGFTVEVDGVGSSAVVESLEKEVANAKKELKEWEDKLQQAKMRNTIF